MRPSAIPVDLDYPFTGRWLAQNSPADRVPSHGTVRFGSSHAIDFVPVDELGRSARLSVASLLRPTPAVRFAGLGRPILVPISGVIVSAHDGEPDHDAYRGIPSLWYALTQPRRMASGWRGLAGNHVLIEADAGVIALAHLRQGSLRVRTGDRVRMGDVLAACGNSGNSTEPHLHLQAVDSFDIERASALPIRFRGALPHNGQIVEVPN